MVNFTITDIKRKEMLFFESISGSKAYGLNTATSDTDIRGIFILPEDDFFGLDYIEQIQNETSDIVYFELKRFVELLSKSNPTMLEMLAMPEDCIRFQHPLFNYFKIEDFLSKQCQATFAGYALTQVKKARGLNKKILNPVEPERKSVLDFCYVIQGQGSVHLKSFLKRTGLKQHQLGLANIPHMHELFGLYADPNGNFKGIIQRETANDISLSSIPKDLNPVAYLSFNKSGYSSYCKDYKEYWDWVEKRNDARYQNTLSHGKNYDAKNLMHTFRLLAMAEEIAREGKVNVRRADREFLLKIKSGEFEYDYLLNLAESKIAAMDQLYSNSSLPEKPDLQRINQTLIEVRKKFYKKI